MKNRIKEREFLPLIDFNCIIRKHETLLMNNLLKPLPRDTKSLYFFLVYGHVLLTGAKNSEWITSGIHSLYSIVYYKKTLLGFLVTLWCHFFCSTADSSYDLESVGEGRCFQVALLCYRTTDFYRVVIKKR